jgi:two-component system chemotaxis response regulator CheY
MNRNEPPVVAVVDDDSVYQFTASRTLKATHLANQILQFQNGKEALAFLKDAGGNHPLPDIIFLDLNMPITDGWAFLEEFSRFRSGLGKEIRIYVVSSSIDPRDRNRAIKFPEVSDYIEKPVSITKFSEVLIDWRKARKES